MHGRVRMHTYWHPPPHCTKLTHNFHSSQNHVQKPTLVSAPVSATLYFSRLYLTDNMLAASFKFEALL